VRLLAALDRAESERRAIAEGNQRIIFGVETGMLQEVHPGASHVAA